MDNAPTFMSGEFQNYCQARGIAHLTGAPYHPATNGAAKRLVQTFKQSVRKSDKAPRDVLFEFLIQYRQTTTAIGYSPSELLTGRQIRTKLDLLLPCPAHRAQGKQAHIATKAQSNEVLCSVTSSYEVGDPCYVLYYGPRHSHQPRWVPAIVTKRHGTRNVNVRVLLQGPTWRRHVNQLRPRYATEDDTFPSDDPNDNQASALPHHEPKPPTRMAATDNSVLSSGHRTSDTTVGLVHSEYGPENLRRSKRVHQPLKLYCC